MWLLLKPEGMGLACAIAAAVTFGATLTVRIEGVRSTAGVVQLALFRTADGFPEDAAKAARTLTVKAAGTLVVTVDLEPGTWALAVLHDENENGRLDRGLFGVPKEGVGASNHPRGLRGVPRFDDARFDVRAAAVSMAVRLSYWL